MNKFLLCTLLIALLAYPALAETAPTGMQLVPVTMSVRIGETAQLEAFWVTNEVRRLTWSSSNPAVAVVNCLDLEDFFSPVAFVTGISPGTATISVIGHHGHTGTATVTVTSVYVPVTGITLNKSATSIMIGATEQLAATVLPSIGLIPLTWNSSNPAVATASSSGLVTGISVGTAEITVSRVDTGDTATCVITVTSVYVPVTGITLNKPATSIQVGGTEQLTTTISPENATNQNVTWSSSNTAVATVSSSGLVTGISIGTAEITVRAANGLTEICHVAVTPETNETNGGCNTLNFGMLGFALLFAVCVFSKK